ncbi:MAG: hypothetical protein IJ007_07385 [Oscillospiraceae bacterium]|nr:hypothetical protein [Oscillospiraceae bacterium]
MAYIDTDYYLNNYGGTQSDDYDRLFARAENDIDSITGYRIKALGFEALTDFQREQVKLAAAAQADHIEKNGGIYASDSSSAVQMTLGRFSYMNASGTSSKKSVSVSSAAIAALEPTGLLCRSLTIGG